MAKKKTAKAVVYPVCVRHAKERKDVRLRHYFLCDDLLLARGLAAYLHSTFVDVYFRQSNGHTQVNATDLRSLKYPTLEQLHSLGGHVSDVFPSQEQIDALVERGLELAPTSSRSCA